MTFSEIAVRSSLGQSIAIVLLDLQAFFYILHFLPAHLCFSRFENKRHAIRGYGEKLVGREGLYQQGGFTAPGRSRFTALRVVSRPLGSAGKSAGLKWPPVGDTPRDRSISVAGAPPPRDSR